MDFPFMELPSEIRLDIYHHGQKQETLPYKITDNIRAPCSTLGLSPQVLRTCNAIREQATPTLYSENVFQFWLGDERYLPGIWHGRLESLASACRRLYQKPTTCRTDGDYDIFRDSSFAHFLRSIGQSNAATLRTLIFAAKEAQIREAEIWTIDVATQLLKYHVPSVCQIQIGSVDGPCDELAVGLSNYIQSGIGEVEGWIRHCDHTNESRPRVSAGEESEIPDPYPNHIAPENSVLHAPWSLDNNNQPENRVPRIFLSKTVHEATALMLHEIPWLRQLSFAGFEDPLAREKLNELQALVRSRCLRNRD